MKPFIKFSNLFLLAVGFLFSASLTAQEINIDQEFSSDTVLMPFTGSSPVYSVKFTGSINLLSDSSLIRVVLIDDHRNHYLVYEAYPLITTDSAFSVNEVCDETCYLDGIVPDSIRIDIINAFLTFNTLTLEPEYIANASQLQVQIKVTNDSMKALKMNQRIQNKGMYWHSDRTTIVGRSFQDKEKYFGKKFNLYGFDYYTGGIFEFIHHKKNYVPNPSSYVSEFDWRNRHSADKPGSLYYNSGCPGCYGWINRPESQGDWNLCWDYTASHTLADFVNIYCNRFKNYNFSEGKILCLTYPNLGNCNSGSLYDAFQAIHGNGGINLQDGCFYVTCSYPPPPPPPLPPGPTNCSDPCSSDKIDFSTYPNLVWNTQEDLQKAIITLGPIASGILFPSYSIYYHAMELVGYKTIHALDTVYSQSSPMPNNYIIIPNDEPDKNVWIFKNSAWPDPPPLLGPYPPHWVLYEDDNNFSPFVPPIYLTGPVKSSNQYTDLTKQCEDRDDDGYYWWGTGTMPTGCSGNPNEEDCDDSNKGVGTYNLNYSLEHPLYECQDNCPDGIFISNEFNPWSVYYVNTLALELVQQYLKTLHPDWHGINQPIIVPQGKILTVSSTIRMHPLSYIKVLTSGKLIIYNGGKLTSSCNRLWQGIQVFGSSAGQSYTFQGAVEIDGIIEDAVVGIETKTGLGTESGAIIKAMDHALFKNNRTSIKLMKYANPITLSTFDHCTFETNDTLNDGSTPIHFVNLAELSHPLSVKFKGCTFKEGKTSSFSHRKITGIYSDNSRFTVTSGTQFDSLRYGIYAISNQNPGTSFTVDGATFKNNYGAIYVSGVKSPQIVSNIIDVPPISWSNYPWIGIDAYTAYGIYLEGSDNYHVEADTVNGHYIFTDQPTQYIRSCGAYIKNSAPPYINKIYRNTFSALNTAVASFGENRNETGSFGLEIKCNALNGNGTNIGVYRGILNPTSKIGIKYDQGVFDVNPNHHDPAESAGNDFSSSSPCNYFDIDNTNGNNVRYNYHKLTSTYKKIKPNPVLNTERHENIGSLYDENLSCPSTLNNNNPSLIQSLQNNIIEAENKIDSLTNLLYILTDGGNSDSLNLAILFSIPPDAWDLYLDLMSKSPYLSDSVLKSSALKENVLINALIRDIMVANPQSAKSDSIIEFLQNRFIPLPDSMMAEILAGKDTLGSKEILEQTRNQWYQIYGESFNGLMTIYQADTTITGTNDSITSLLENDFRYETKYSLAFHLLYNGNITQANNVMDSIPLDYALNTIQTIEYQKYLCYYQCVKRAILNNESLTYDSLQITVLDSLVNADTNYINIPTIYARNALQSAGLMTYNEYLIFDNSDLKSSDLISVPVDNHTKRSNVLKVFPNPAVDFIVVDYKGNPGIFNREIIIYDIDGTTLLKIWLTKSQDQKIINIKGFPNGSYIVALIEDHKIVKSQKVIITR